jgi:Arc/MetJ-type ribon-helix-helix transcriptional regulator
MESLTIKLDRAMLKAIEESMKPLYATKTEFVREALRKHIETINKEKVLTNLKANLGKYRHKNTSDEDLERIKEQALAELIKEKGWKL